ncbi:MAG: hypothetical protein ACXWQR_11425 [Ktedonobacterales bacterium]
MSRPTLLRLALAFLIGLLVGAYTDVTLSTAALVDILISAAVLAVPPLVSLLIDPTLRRRGLALLLTAIGMLLILGGLPLADALFNQIQGFPGVDLTSLLVLDLLLAPLVAAFALGALGPRLNPTIRLAIGCALAAWLGVGLHHVALPYPLGLCRALNGSTEFADLACIARGILWAIATLLAVAGGILGALLRTTLNRHFG